MQPLGSLTRGAQLRRLRRVLPEVYASYGLIQPTARLLRYEDNAVYVIVSGDGRRTLRLSIRNGRTTDEQVSELRWIEALLRDSRVRVPCPVPTRFGAPVVDVDSPHLEVAATAVMFEWIPGKIPPRGQIHPSRPNWGPSPRRFTTTLRVLPRRKVLRVRAGHRQRCFTTLIRQRTRYPAQMRLG